MCIRHLLNECHDVRYDVRLTLDMGHRHSAQVQPPFDQAGQCVCVGLGLSLEEPYGGLWPPRGHEPLKMQPIFNFHG